MALERPTALLLELDNPGPIWYNIEGRLTFYECRKGGRPSLFDNQAHSWYTLITLLVGCG